MSLAQAIYTDCNKVLTNYEKNATQGTFKFSEFAKEWREMKFELIFAGRQYMGELPYFCRLLFYIAKRFMFQQSSSQIKRVGAFFLCYSLYEKQPLKLKVRLTLDELKTLLSLVRQLQHSNNSLEPMFIFSKMLVDNAFHFCATSTDHMLLGMKPAETKEVPAELLNLIPASQIEEFFREIDTCSLSQLNHIESMLG